MQTETVIENTGWTWKDAEEMARECAREALLFPNPMERALARFDGFEEGIDFGDEPTLDEVLAHRRAERQDRRTHRTAAQRIAHQHGECTCFKHS